MVDYLVWWLLSLLLLSSILSSVLAMLGSMGPGDNRLVVQAIPLDPSQQSERILIETPITRSFRTARMITTDTTPDNVVVIEGNNESSSNPDNLDKEDHGTISSTTVIDSATPPIATVQPTPAPQDNDDDEKHIPVQQVDDPLPIHEINVLVLTDVHSWVGGHNLKDNASDADYGDILSFYEHLKNRITKFQTSSDHSKRHSNTLMTAPDLYFVVNGDWIDGTGLSLNGDAFSLLQVLQKMPWDAVNLGNHELYHASVVEYIQQPGGFVDWWNGGYLTSNVVRADSTATSASPKPIGNRYAILRGATGSTTLLAMGFLYNMQDHVDSVVVQQVQEVVQQDWFRDALLNESYDAILVLAHMHCRDPLVHVILTAIRRYVDATVPVQFITGHTHVRDYTVLDEWSTSFEAGRFLDTLGFVSFPTRTTVERTIASSPSTSTTTAVTNNSSKNHTDGTKVLSPMFQHRYWNANRQLLQDTLGVASLPTKRGSDLSRFIANLQDELGLTQDIGCVEKSYFVDNGLDEPQSLWAFFDQNVVQTQFESDQVVILGKGQWRYDLVGGRLQVGDVIAVSPFNDTLFRWDNISVSVILQLNATLNSNRDISWLTKLPDYVMSSLEHMDNSTDGTFDVITAKFDRKRIQSILQDLGVDSEPVQMGATTLSIWLDHVRQYHQCSNELSGSEWSWPWQSPSRSNNSKQSTSKSNANSPNSSKAVDGVRLLFVVLAVVLVALLSSYNIWQRNRSYRHGQILRERSIQDAFTEFQGNDIYSDGYQQGGTPDDGDDDSEVERFGEEGYFVASGETTGQESANANSPLASFHLTDKEDIIFTIT